MINLTDYLVINEAKKITLPYTFDVYPNGGKNKDFAITKQVLKNAILSLANDNEKYNPYEHGWILRCWVEDKSDYGKLPDLMPLIYRDRHNQSYEYNYNEREELWSQFFNLIVKKYGKTKLKLDYDDKEKCFTLTIDDLRYEKDLEQHKKDVEAEKKASEEAEKKRKELENQKMYTNPDDKERVGSRRNIGKPGEAVLTKWGWYTGD